VLGARRTWQSRKAKRRAVEVKVEFQYIPILEMLKVGWGLPTYNWWGM